MRQGPSNRRVRGSGNNTGRRGNLPNRNQTFDSNGPDVRIRGTAVQVNEKYQSLARDAMTSGDRIMAENYFQHAEHYYRIIAAINEAHSQSQQQSEAVNRPRENAPRDNVQRDNLHRENGHERNRDGAVNASEAAASNAGLSDAAPEMEFGEDPRQDDPRDAPPDLTNGKAVIDAAGAPPPKEAELAETRSAGNREAGADADGDEPQAPKPRRRGPGRPRKTSAAKDSAPAVPEANTDGD